MMLRPMRPNPLMPTLMPMLLLSDLDVRLRFRGASSRARR